MEITCAITFPLSHRQIILASRGNIRGANTFAGEGFRSIRNGSHVAIEFLSNRVHRGQPGVLRGLRVFPRIASVDRDHASCHQLDDYDLLEDLEVPANARLFGGG